MPSGWWCIIQRRWLYDLWRLKGFKLHFSVCIIYFQECLLLVFHVYCLHFYAVWSHLKCSTKKSTLPHVVRNNIRWNNSKSLWKGKLGLYDIVSVAINCCKFQLQDFVYTNFNLLRQTKVYITWLPDYQFDYWFALVETFSFP